MAKGSCVLENLVINKADQVLFLFFLCRCRPSRLAAAKSHQGSHDTDPSAHVWGFGAQGLDASGFGLELI